MVRSAVDITVDLPNPLEDPAPFPWPEGVAECRTRVTVHQGQVTGLNAGGCDPALAAEIEQLRALRFVPDDQHHVLIVALVPPVDGELAAPRLEPATVSPATWEPSARALTIPTGTRCRANLSFSVDLAEAVLDPGCPEPLAAEIRRAVQDREWRVSWQTPVAGIVFHAAVDFQVIPDAARRKGGTLAVELGAPSLRTGPASAVGAALTEAGIRNVDLKAAITVDPAGRVSNVAVEGCTEACQKVALHEIQGWIYWPAFADGVAIQSQTALMVKSQVTP